MAREKLVLLIGIIATVGIVLFTAVFCYFGAQDVKDLEQQIKDTTKNRKNMTLEMNHYNKAVETDDIDGLLRDVVSAGVEVADIQNKMMAEELVSKNPIDAAGSYVYSDKKAVERMKQLFPGVNEFYCTNAWCSSVNAKCVFNGVFMYNAAAIPVNWRVTVNGRTIGLITAKYNTDTKVFDDFVVYKTVFGDTMAENAYDVMVKNLNKDKEDNDDASDAEVSGEENTGRNPDFDESLTARREDGSIGIGGPDLDEHGQPVKRQSNEQKESE